MTASARRIRLVTFDAMKTLITLREPVGKLYSDFARRRFQITLDPNSLTDAFLENYRRHDKQNPCFGYGSRQSRAASVIDRQKRWWTRVVKGAFSDVAPIAEHRLDALSSDLYDYFASTEPWALNPSTRSLLDLLARKGVSLAILSNFDSRLRGIAAQFRLDQYVRAFFLSGETGLAKPNEQLFRLVERTMIVDADEAAHVGDDLEKDYLAAKSCGWRAFLFRPSSDGFTGSAGGVDSNDVISDLSDLRSKIL